MLDFKALFNTEEKKKEAVEIFQNLLQREDWKLFEEVIDCHIEDVKEQLLSGARIEGNKEETIEVIRRLRDALYYLRRIKNIPQELINLFTAEEGGEIPEIDPFYKREELEELRRLEGAS